MCGYGVILSFATFIVAIRGIGVGLWPQSETPMAAIHFCASLCLIGLMLLLMRSKPIWPHLKSPLVLIPFLIGTLSLVLLPFSDSQVLSFLGAVQTGEGVVWWFDISVLSAGSMLLWRLPRWRKAIITAAIFSFCVCFILSVSHFYLKHFYAPLFFPDYLAFPVLAFMPFVYLHWSREQKGISFHILFYVALNALLFSTRNYTMTAFGLIAPVFFWILSSRLNERFYKILSFSAIAVIPLFCIFLFLVIPQFHTDQGYYNYATTGAFRTIASRAYLIQVSLDSQIEAPATFLTGYGWGKYSDHLARYQPTQWLDLINFNRAQWDGLVDEHFHSHNMFIDTLNAIGILGCVLLFLYYLSFALRAKKSMKNMAVLQSAGFMAWVSLWFYLPIHLPFLVFAATSGCNRSAPKFLKKLLLPKTILIGLSSVIALMQAGSGVLILRTALNTNDYDASPVPVEKIHQDCTMDYNDFGAGGSRLSKLLLDRVRYTVDLADTANQTPEKKEGPETIPEHVASINHLFCQSKEYGRINHASTKLTLATLMSRGEMLLGLYDYMDEPTRSYYYNGWEGDLKEWLDYAPLRSDIATPYLLYHMIHGEDDHSNAIIDQIYEHNSEDPVGLWFKGLAALNQPENTKQGLDMMRKALDRGIKRFIVVDDETFRMLEQKPN